MIRYTKTMLKEGNEMQTKVNETTTQIKPRLD